MLRADRAILAEYHQPFTAAGLSFLSIMIISHFNAFDFKLFAGKTGDLSFIIFGFMLTVLTITMSLRSLNKTLFKRMVKFNRRVVVLALILGLFLLYFNSMFSYIESRPKIYYWHSILLFFLLYWLLLDSFFFLRKIYQLALK